VSLAHQNGVRLMPVVRAWAGVRHDQRFHRAGDLAAFDDPTGRLFFGAVVNAIRIAGRSAKERGGSTLFAIGGGFEWERALRGANQLPSGFRAMLSADLDLMTAMGR
jgi:hypothetical protein